MRGTLLGLFGLWKMESTRRGGKDRERGMDRLDESDRRNHSNGSIDGIVCVG